MMAEDGTIYALINGEKREYYSMSARLWRKYSVFDEMKAWIEDDAHPITDAGVWPTETATETIHYFVQ